MVGERLFLINLRNYNRLFSSFIWGENNVYLNPEDQILSCSWVTELFVTVHVSKAFVLCFKEYLFFYLSFSEFNRITIAQLYMFHDSKFSFKK